MQLPVAPDARPQVRVLLLALALTLVLWFIPFAGIVTYPIRLFVTFIHEGGHALAALLTGNSVGGLEVLPGGGGLVYASGRGLAGLLIASAGYLGAMLYGALLLVLIRHAVAARAVLTASGGFVLGLTLVYGFPHLFTLAAGVLLGLGLLAAAKYASPRVASFLVSFLAVQCIANALFDLRTLLLISAPFSGARTDAANMARATGIPALAWALVWTVLALVILVGALRVYAGSRYRAPGPAFSPARRRLRV